MADDPANEPAEDPADAFDAIVEGLDLDLDVDLDLNFGVEEERPTEPLPMSSWQPSIEPPVARPRNPRRLAAVWAVLACPALLLCATVGGWVLPRPLVGALALIFVAGSIYLISQLPEHGPSHPDWPDDGAVL